MSLAFRAYFALPPDLATSAGIVTNAVHGFTSMLLNLVRDHHPIGLAVAFDLPGGTFRDEIVADYKGGRVETPADLLPQFEMIRAVLEAAGHPGDRSRRLRGRRRAGHAGHRGPRPWPRRDHRHRRPRLPTSWSRTPISGSCTTGGGSATTPSTTRPGIEERTGVRPEQYPVLAALRGDPSDNLPGVPGVGEKTAAKLINEYGDLDTLYATPGRPLAQAAREPGRPRGAGPASTPRSSRWCATCPSMSMSIELILGRLDRGRRPRGVRRARVQDASGTVWPP